MIFSKKIMGQIVSVFLFDDATLHFGTTRLPLPLIREPSDPIGIVSLSITPWITHLPGMEVTSVITLPTHPLGICMCSIAANVAEISVI